MQVPDLSVVQNQMGLQPGQQLQQQAPDQGVVDQFEAIYFNLQNTTTVPGSDTMEIAKRSIGEIVVGKLEAVQHQSEENLKVIEGLLNRITAPGHTMTIQEAVQFQAAELAFVQSQALTGVVAKKAGDAVKTLFTNQ